MGLKSNSLILALSLLWEPHYVILKDPCNVDLLILIILI